MRHILATCALALIFPACAARAPGPPASRTAIERPDARDQLQRDLRSMFDAAEVDHVQWGVNFHSLRDAETLYSLDAFRFMVPASNQKLLTTAVAAARLGWNYRFTTRVLATGPIAQDGAVHGDLVIIGNGDPTINPRHPQRWRAFDAWAAALKARGITAIHGNLVGDDNAFDEPGWGVGWAWDNLQYGYGAPPSALQFNENQVEVLITPGIAPGTPAIITTSPLGSGLVIDPAVTTAAPGGEVLIDIARVPGTPVLKVRGQIAMDGRPTTLTASVPNPTRFYLTVVRDALARHGIAVSGSVMDIDDLTTPLMMDGATELLVDWSAPLSEMVDVTMKWSRNIYAETLLLALAPPGEPATGTRGLEPVRDTLRAWGILADSYMLLDGSCLSRYVYLTDYALTTLLINFF
ncbi:MAG: D-alanyl-D-alanine carboxypeptidase/D-alanyl-D-alanine-endopeptidase [Acidobacteria bacterium]|nr:D-alanyl-D-alanine carboxypeptidase/D-alanyl-D-alanine-endopeptidase [Acidobacteriota bacterium]